MVPPALVASIFGLALVVAGVVLLHRADPALPRAERTVGRWSTGSVPLLMGLGLILTILAFAYIAAVVLPQQGVGRVESAATMLGVALVAGGLFVNRWLYPRWRRTEQRVTHLTTATAPRALTVVAVTVGALGYAAFALVPFDQGAFAIWTVGDSASAQVRVGYWDANGRFYAEPPPAPQSLAPDLKEDEDPTATDTATATNTNTATATSTNTPTATPTETELPTCEEDDGGLGETSMVELAQEGETETATATATETETETATATETETETATATETETATATETETETATETATETETETATETATETETGTATETETETQSPTNTPTPTPTETPTPTATATQSPTGSENIEDCVPADDDEPVMPEGGWRVLVIEGPETLDVDEAGTLTLKFEGATPTWVEWRVPVYQERDFLLINQFGDRWRTVTNRDTFVDDGVFDPEKDFAVDFTFPRSGCFEIEMTVQYETAPTEIVEHFIVQVGNARCEDPGQQMPEQTVVGEQN